MPLTGCGAAHERLQWAPSLMGCENVVTAAMASYDGLAVDSQLPCNDCMRIALLLSVAHFKILDAGRLIIAGCEKTLLICAGKG